MTDKKIAANCLNNIMYFFQNGKKTIDKQIYFIVVAEINKDEIRLAVKKTPVFFAPSTKH